MKYREFVINAWPVPLKAGSWSAELDIEKHSGDGVLLTPFAVQGTYESEESAIEASILHGCKMIDDGFSA